MIVVVSLLLAFIAGLVCWWLADVYVHAVEARSARRVVEAGRGVWTRRERTRYEQLTATSTRLIAELDTLEPDDPELSAALDKVDEALAESRLILNRVYGGAPRRPEPRLPDPSRLRLRP